MKREKNIKDILRTLKKKGEDERLIKALEWVVDDEMDFSEVVPDIPNPTKKVDGVFFDSNSRVEKWVMRYPVDQDIIVVRQTLPSRGQYWWVKKDMEYLKDKEWVEEQSLERGLFGISETPDEQITRIMTGAEKPPMDWQDAYKFYLKWQEWFRFYVDAEKYLAEEFAIDYSTCVKLGTKQRKELSEKYETSNAYLKEHLHNEGLEYIYQRKIGGDVTWLCSSET